MGPQKNWSKTFSSKGLGLLYQLPPPNVQFLLRPCSGYFFSWMQWSILKLQILTFIKFFNQSDSFWQITHWINYQTLKTESDWSRNSDLYFWNWWALHPAGPNIRRGKIRSGWRISFCFLPNWWQNKWLPICNSFKSFAKSHGNGLIFLFLQLAICFPIFEFLSSFFNTLLNTL